MGELLRIEKWAENLEEVTLGRWLKGEGEVVEAGEGICEIITEKVTFEYESPMSGVLLRVYAPEKSVMPVGYAFAFVGRPGEQPPDGVEVENQRLADAHLAQTRLSLDLAVERMVGGAPEAAGTVAEEYAAGAGRVRAAPAARRLAREHGLSLAQVAQWLGEERPVSAEDVERYLAENR